MDYGIWQRSNPAKAQRLLDEDPELSREDIYSAAAAGDVTAVRSMLDRDPALVNQRGGVLRWEPFLYACYSRLEPMRLGRRSKWYVCCCPVAPIPMPDSSWVAHTRSRH